MDRMDDITLEQTVPRINIFYRVAPKHKLKIVKVFSHLQICTRHL